MQSNKPLQPAFKIRVKTSLKTATKTPNREVGRNVGKGEAFEVMKNSGIPFTSQDSFIDVEAFTSGSVVYSEEATRINTLSFKIDKFADILLYYFQIGTNVEFWGGNYQYGGAGMRKIFEGSVTRIITNFDDNGRPSFSVSCMAFGFVKLGNAEKSFSYPDEKSSRFWARKPSLSVAGIVKGICNDANVDVDIDIKEKTAGVRYTKAKQIRQTDQSDWAFLGKLAQLTGCSLWTTYENGKEIVHFCSSHEALKRQSDISFVFPLSGDYKKVAEIPESAIIDYGNNFKRPRLLSNLTIEEDIAQADSVTRSAIYFNKETGEQEEAMAEIEVIDGKRYIIFYELDENRVKEVEEKYPDIANKIRWGSPTSLKWKKREKGKKDPSADPTCLNYYYKVTKRYDEATAMFDSGFFGVHVTAKCPLDLNVTSQRSYRLYGVLRYITMAIDEVYYLRSLKHVWSSDGAWTDLDFML